jgi:hypothetical protein
MIEGQSCNRPIYYPKSNIYPQIGDQVRFGTPDILTVEDVIDSLEKRQKWGIDECGVILVGGIYGRVFTRIDADDLEFLSRLNPN